jgi:hypothetical protein
MTLLVALLILTVVCAPIVALPLVVIAPVVFVLRRTFIACDAQPLALIALVSFRAPPV